MHLEVKNLTLHYETNNGIVKAVNSVSFSLQKGETLAIVGESGSGKSSLAYAIIKLLPKNIATYDGEVIFNGFNIVSLPENELRKRVRVNGISMVFQGAMNTLNPVLTIGDQVADPLVTGLGMSRKEAFNKAVEALSLVGIRREFAKRYPHELSGGMKQRVAIAMALVVDPQIIILDEPTSALDIITQANIMNLLKKLKNELKKTYIFITHDLALASELADRVGIMYAGRLVEIGPAESVFINAKHPYTQLLIDSVPTLRVDKEPRFIPGSPPDLINPPSGCPFHPRCPYIIKGKCETEEPTLKQVGENHYAACWLNET
ncbi:MAG: ABC transporter ATP-binding protein [Candidatus Caldarchaeum sp.]